MQNSPQRELSRHRETKRAKCTCQCAVTHTHISMMRTQMMIHPSTTMPRVHCRPCLFTVLPVIDFYFVLLSSLSLSCIACLPVCFYFPDFCIRDHFCGRSIIAVPIDCGVAHSTAKFMSSSCRHRGSVMQAQRVSLRLHMAQSWHTCSGLMLICSAGVAHLLRL